MKNVKIFLYFLISTFVIGMLILPTMASDKNSKKATESASPLDTIQEQLQNIFTKNSSVANCQRQNYSLSCAYQTQTFLVHTSDLNGQYLPQTYHADGPNAQGFLINLEERDGQCPRTLLVMPQELDEPYWRTYVNQYNLSNGHCLSLSFAYGSRVNEELKKQIVQTIDAMGQQADPEVKGKYSQ
ncbi:MAG: hypothetical protein NUV91_01760 [Candidatus Omnitrophica bacterium]|nr:hypothetical protein [Candidatus Omnitrophota bacterium]